MPETNVGRAVQEAMAFFQANYGRAVSELAVEEIEHTAAGDWLVTLGYTPPGVVRMPAMSNTAPPREYKVFRVRAGKVMSMKIRKPQAD